MRRHCIISGTGRAGTSLLVQIATHAGLPTGFDQNTLALDSVAQAGLEHDLRDATAPYIVKSPWICTYITEITTHSDIVIDHAIIPVRKLDDAASSRARIQRSHKGAPSWQLVPGGLWLTAEPEQQANLLAVHFHNLIVGLVTMEVPITFLEFPRLAMDPDYLFKKLSPIFLELRRDVFGDAFRKCVRPELIGRREGG